MIYHLFNNWIHPFAMNMWRLHEMKCNIRRHLISWCSDCFIFPHHHSIISLLNTFRFTRLKLFFSLTFPIHYFQSYHHCPCWTPWMCLWNGFPDLIPCFSHPSPDIVSISNILPFQFVSPSGICFTIWNLFHHLEVFKVENSRPIVDLVDHIMNLKKSLWFWVKVLLFSFKAEASYLNISWILSSSSHRILELLNKFLNIFYILLEYKWFEWPHTFIGIVPLLFQSKYANASLYDCTWNIRCSRS